VTCSLRLWQTLRTAELAGLDPGRVVRDAVAERDLAGSRDVAAVIDARIRDRVSSLVPQPPRRWSDQVPAIGDPDRRAYVAQIAAMMDARRERIGEHAAEHALPWAVAALGPVPADLPDRLRWQQRASAIGAYRELHGYDHPADPIGPEPAGDTPDKRAAWYEALAALGPVTGPDVRGLPDGSLLHLRETYPVETAWAPPWVGGQLRQVRRGAEDAQFAAVRAGAEAEAARRDRRGSAAERHDALAASYQAMATAYQERETVLAAVMDDRHEWERATVQQRRLAIAADAEVRRRHPDQSFEPLRSAAPVPVTEPESGALVLVPGQETAEVGQWIQDLEAGHSAFADQLAERHSPTLRTRNLAHGDLGRASPAWQGAGSDAILQSPKPQIPPSARVLARARELQADIEAVH
jgi:hypothetical protein